MQYVQTNRVLRAQRLRRLNQTEPGYNEGNEHTMIDKPFYQNVVAKTSCDVRKCFLGVGRLHKAFQAFSVEDFTSSSIHTVLPDTFLDGFRITLACVGEACDRFVCASSFAFLTRSASLLTRSSFSAFFLFALFPNTAL